MADCFITRRGGGGIGGLNFEVVGGTTQPTNQKENTIWVNTNTDITSWVFSADQPESPTQGLVWIALSVTSDVELNALKKNAIQLYLSTAMQYVSGKWVKKDALIYQNGEWFSLWDGVLYYNGNQYDAITGGWEQNPLSTYFDDPNTGDVTFNSGNIYLHGDDASCLLTTKKKVNVSSFDALRFEVTVTGDIYNDLYGLVANAASDVGKNAIAFAESSKSGLQTITVDVSSISGEYYVCVGTSAGSGYRPRTIHKIWLE